jgi:hypothetical protein
VDTLLANAERILETATLSGAGPVTILLRGGRPVQLTVANDWSLDSLLAERGADQAFRVSRSGGCVTVEGRSRTRSCSVSERPAARPVALIPGRPPEWQNVA